MFGLNKYMIVGLVVFIGLAGLYFWYSQNQIASLNEELGQAKTAIEVQQQTIAQMYVKVEQFNKASAAHEKKIREIDEQTNRLDKLFSDHNLGKLIEAKPGLMERRINDGTTRVIKEFEDLSK